MLRALTTWLVPTTKEDPIAPVCCKSYGDVASRRFIFRHMPDGSEPIPAPRKRRSLDDGPRPYPVHNSPPLTTARSISPPSDVSEEELEEAMAQFTEISFSALHRTPRDTTNNTTTHSLATKATADEQNSKDEKEVLPPPKCWCRLPTNAKEARMRANDPLNPGRAYWTCANVGGACNFFQWAEASPATKRPPSTTSTSTSSTSTSPILSRASAAAVDDSNSREPLSVSPPSPAEGSKASGPKPYRTSAPIPIPRAAGEPANRRRTPTKSAQDGQDASC